MSKKTIPLKGVFTAKIPLNQTQVRSAISLDKMYGMIVYENVNDGRQFSVTMNKAQLREFAEMVNSMEKELLDTPEQKRENN